MKQIKFKIALGLVTLFMAMGTISCTDKSEVEDSKEIAETHNEAKFENSTTEYDAQFLVNAAEINLQEINLGMLAQQNSTNADVLELGKMIEEDHTKSMNELKELALNKNITIPVVSTESAVKEYEELKTKKGNEFDKKYCETMVSGHKNAVTIFEKASTDAIDLDIKNWAIATLSILRNHSDKAISCEMKIKTTK
jgi:putative membrane protein